MRVHNRRGFALVSVMLFLVILFILMFSLLTMSEQRQKLVRTNSDRTVLSAESRAGIAEAAHYLNKLADWSTASDNLPDAEASLNAAAGAFRKLEVVDESATEVTVRSVAYTKDHGGDVALSRRLEATFRRKGVGFPNGAIYGANGAHLDSNARTDSYESDRGSYASTQGHEGHVGSNGTGDGSVSLDPNSEVDGYLVVREGTEPDAKGSYNGIDYTTNPQPLPLPTPPPSLSASTSQGDVEVGKKETVTLSPGHYGSLSVGTQGVLVLNGGTYLFDGDFSLDQNTELKVINGNAVIYFRGTVEFGSNTLLNMDGSIEDSKKLQFFGDATSTEDKTVTINSFSQFVGMIYNPTDYVEVESHATLYGGLVGETVRLRSNAVAHFDRSLTDVTVAATPEGKPEIKSWQSW